MRSWEHRIKRIEKELLPPDKEALLDQWISDQNFPDGWTYCSISHLPPENLKGTCVKRALKELCPDKERA